MRRPVPRPDANEEASTTRIGGPVDERVWPKLVHLLLWAVSTGVLLWEITTIPWDDMDFWAVVGITGGLWLIIGVSYAIWATWRRTMKPTTLPSSPVNYGVDWAELAWLCDVDSGKLLGHQAELFVRSLERPERVFSRITEHVESYHRSIKVRTTYTALIAPPVDAQDAQSLDEQVDGGQPDPILGYVLPLHLPSRGRILNGLRLFDEKNSRVSTLDAQQVSTFSAAVIRLLIRNVSEFTFRQYLDTVEESVLQLICGFTPASDQQISAVIEEILVLSAPVGTGQQLKLATRVVKQLAKVHPVCVTVPENKVREAGWPYGHRFTMERRIMPSIDVVIAQKKLAWPRQVADLLREVLGVRLNRIYYVLSASTRAKSYHVEIEGPEGTYLAGDELLFPAASDGEELNGSTTPRLGQRRSHTYVNRNTYAEPVFIATRFYERAPGSFATTTLSALAATVVVWLIALNETASATALAAGKAPLTQQTWLIPALLAVPLAVATLSGLDLSKVPKHPSLLSRGINLATVGLVIAAFVFSSLGHDKIDVPPHLWILLPGLGVSLVIVSGVTWILRLTLERYFVQGKDK